MFDINTQPQSLTYRQNTKLTIPLLLIVLLFGSFAYGRVIYVDDDAAGANDGSSWADAYRYLQDALAHADSADKPVEIRVAQGVYKPDQGSGITPGDRDISFQLINGVTLMGGYAGFAGLDPDTRNVEAYVSVLSGDLGGNDVELSNPSDLEEEPTRAENSDSVVVGSGTDETAVLDGFIITGGGGMKNESGSPTVSNCKFSWNCAKDYLGGGMLNDSASDPILINCAFVGNWANYGGGMHSRGNPMLINCRFIGNATKNNGAGMDNGGEALLINCVFFENKAGFFGGGVENTGRPLLINCTFTKNSAGEQGGGVSSAESSPTLVNCILWDNTPDQVHGDPMPTISYSDVQGGWPGQGNVDADPWFDDDLRLLGGSPCIDAGNNSPASSVFTDCAGNARIINDRVDMGAYESPMPIFLLSASSLTVPEGQTATFTVALIDAPLETIQVTVAHYLGDEDIRVESGGLLTFTAQNYAEPQTVTLGAAQDSDNLNGAAQIRIEAPGFTGVVLAASEFDDDHRVPMIPYVDVEVPGAIYVDTDATGTSDGSSWENAYSYLQNALADANSADKPVEIRVAQGIYGPDQGANQTPGDQHATFQLINDVTIKGSYAGFGELEPNARDADTYETILSGDLNNDDDDDDNDDNDDNNIFNDSNKSDNSYHVLTGSGTDPTAVLDGFTITAGVGRSKGESNDRSFGGGMYNYKGSPTLLNCTFVRNSVGGFQTATNWYGGGMYGYGGGMYNSSSTPTLINCTFADNGARPGNCRRGGGMYNSSSDPVLIGCTFSGNYAGDGGGGMYNRRSSPMLLDCRFSANRAGGMQNLSSSDPMLINCIFSGNSGGAMQNSSGSLTIVNCTFADNSGKNANALACEMSDVHVINSILWDGGNEISQDDDSHITITYSDVQGGWPGEGNIDTDPRFAQPGYWGGDGQPWWDYWVDGDYRLQSQAGRWDPNKQSLVQDALTSPCIDAGDNPALPPWVFADFDGHARITNATVDMGAYESTAYEPSEAGFVLSTQWVKVPEAGTAQFTVRLAQDPLGTVEVTIAQQSGDADMAVLSGALLSFDSSNYARPQSVTIAAAEDGDSLRGLALIRVSAPGLAPAGIIAGEWDTESATLYVDADAEGANDGSSWADAFANLQDALRRARMNAHIEQIRVAQGIYRPDRGQGITAGDRDVSFELFDGVALMGGYAGWGEPDPNARDIKQYETILSGDLNGNDAQVAHAVDLSAESTRAENTSTVVRAEGGQHYQGEIAAVLAGFTITGGNGPGLGAGMRIWYANTTVSNCTFRGNSTGDGGGLFISRSVSSTLTNCTFIANAALSGGGMANYRSNTILTNCTFNANAALSGGAMSSRESNLTLINCTFRRNYNGTILSSKDSLVLTNCILWANSGGLISRISYDDDHPATVSYSTLQSHRPWSGVGNINTDPLFADPDGPDNIPGTEDDDLRLSLFSPCIDAGDPDYVPEPNETDCAGNARVVSGRIDMGAYEFQGLIYVDDDASDDPGLGDPQVSDPLE